MSTLARTSDYHIDSECRYWDKKTKKWLAGVVKDLSRAKIKVQITNTNEVKWVAPEEVSKQLVAVNKEEDESSSEETGSDERLRVAKNYTAEGSRRSRALSMQIAEEPDAPEEDPFEEGSLVEIWSDSTQKFVVAVVTSVQQLEELDSKLLVVMYKVEQDGVVTTLSKAITADKADNSKTIRPFVNKQHTQDEIEELKIDRDLQRMKVNELNETNDEFLLTIDYQTRAMSQLQKLCEQLQEEKDELQREVEDLSLTIENQQLVIEEYQLLIEEQGEG